MRKMENLDPIELLDHDELSFAQVWRHNESEQWTAINTNTDKLENFINSNSAQFGSFMSKFSQLENRLVKT